MNKKIKLKSVIITVIFSVLISGTMAAQGIFSNNKSYPTDSDSNTDANIESDFITSPLGDGGLFRWGGGYGDNNTEPGTQSEPGPVGEGILILSFLAGGYAAIVKRRNAKNKHEE